MAVQFNTSQFEKKPNRYMPRTKVRVDKLVATQQKIDRAKVKNLASKSPSDVGSDPVVSSAHKGYYHVLDGHHRIAAAIERGDTHVVVRRVK